MPKSTEAYSKVFTPKGSKPIEPTAAQTKEAGTITNELSHLDAHIIGSADQGVRAFENTLDGLRDNGVKLALIVGHSTTVLNGEDAGQRQVQLPDGTSLTLRQIHEAAVLRKMEAIVITCFSPDLSLQRLMAFREAVDSCHYAIEPLPETAAEAEPSHTTSTSSAPLELQSIVQRCHESLDGKSAWSNGVSMSFAAVLLGVANADGTGSQSSSQFVVTGLRRPSWRIWLSAAIALLGYTLVWRTMAAQYPTVAQRPTSVTKIKGHIAKRLHFMARFKTVAVIAAVIVGAIACWMLEWRDDRTEGVKSEINATRVAAYLSIAHASLSIGLIWLRPNISLIGKFLHGIAGAEIYPVITFAGDYRLVPITAVSSFALAFFLNWPVLLMVSLFAATIMAFITLGCVLVGFNLAARGKSPFIESPA
jgi:hypothetical protein